jgi:tRNA nucleotidyltransferase (CCA-adding enzyme)
VDIGVRFAALVHDLGKATTPPAQWPRHHGHEERSVTLIESLCRRLRVPAAYRELAVLVARYHGIVHRAFELRAATIVDFLAASDAFRRPARFADVLLACEADARGRTGFETKPYPQREWLMHAFQAAAAIKPTPADLADHRGEDIAIELRKRRVAAVEAIKKAARD